MLNICLFISVFFVPFLAYSSNHSLTNKRLHEAGINQDIGYFKYLIEQNLNPKVKIKGKTAFDHIKNASHKKDLEIFYEQFQKNAKNQKKHKSLFDMDKIEQILKEDKNFNINIQNAKTGQTSLHQAVILGDIPLITTLLSHKAQLDILDNDGKKALDYASPETLEEIKKIAPDLSLEAFLGKPKDNLPQNDVVFASLKENKAGLEDLLNKDRSLVNAKDFDGNTALHHISVFGNPDDVRSLVEHGALLNERNNNGQTPLIKAASAGNILVAERLLEYNVQINWVDLKGKTPLHIAAEKRDKDLMILLLRHRADTSIKDSLGQRAFEVIEYIDPKMYQELKSYIKQENLLQRSSARQKRVRSLGRQAQGRSFSNRRSR